MKDYKNLSLPNVIKLAQNDDKKALEELVKRNEQKIYNTFSQFDKSFELADLTQEVLLKMTKSIKNLKNPNNFNSWLNRIITNLFYDYLRKRNKITTYSLHITSPFKEFDNEEEIDIEDKSLTPPENTLENELHEKIQEAIKELPSKFKSMIILREIQGLSYDKIANLTNTNVGTVKSRLSRARIKLKEELDSYLK